MTDLCRWDELIKRKATPDGVSKIMIPVDEYLLGNLMGLLKRSRPLANGDWFDEWISIVSQAMTNLSIPQLSSNFSDEFHQGKLWQEVYSQNT